MKNQNIVFWQGQPEVFRPVHVARNLVEIFSYGSQNPLGIADIFNFSAGKAGSSIGTVWISAATKDIGCHSFRSTCITEYLRNSGKLELACQMVNHASAKTTVLYDWRNN